MAASHCKGVFSDHHKSNVLIYMAFVFLEFKPFDGLNPRPMMYMWPIISVRPFVPIPNKIT